MTNPGLLFVGNFLSAGGSNPTYAEAITARLEARAWPVLRTSRRRAKLARLADMLTTTWIKRDSYRIAHVDVFSGAAFLWAEAVCFELRRLRKPHVLTLRGGNLPAFAKQWPRRVAALLRSADAVTTPSSYLRDALAAIAPEIIVVPNALETDRYRFEHRTRSRPKLVWVRAFHEVYNPVLAVDVLALLPESAHLTMIGVDKGDGSLAAVARQAKRLGVADRLEIVPGVPKDEIAGRLAAADIFLNTTNVDNTPVSVLEAMATGLCVVSTNVGGIPHLLTHERDALLTPPRDAAAMAEAIRRLLDEPRLASELSAAARERANACDWSRVLSQWESLFGAVSASA